MPFNASDDTFTVASTDQLNQAIADIDAIGRGGELGADAYTIKFAGDITLGGSTASTYTDADGSALTIDGNSVPGSNQLYAVNLDTGVTLTIDGDDHTLSGDDKYNGLFVYDGAVTIENLMIEHAEAIGGEGGSAGHAAGGGAGLGGGLFIAAGGDTRLVNVSFADDSAQGGAGGRAASDSSGAAGGGGLEGGAGGNARNFSGGGGGVGLSAAGGQGQVGAGAAGVGIVLGAGSASVGLGSGGKGGGAFGGGGGAGPAAGGGGVQASSGYTPTGGFGGGGAGFGVAGGFGGGGGDLTGGLGGFGGGGGASATFVNSGGFGGGSGALATGVMVAGGGGGLGAGGDVFVQQGGRLTIDGGSLAEGTAAGGAATTSGVGGVGLGGGLFIQGDDVVSFNPGAGKTVTVSGVIADEKGSAGALASSQGGFGDDDLPSGGLQIESGTLTLTEDDTYSGATTVAGGTLIVDGSIDNSAVTVESGATLGGNGSAGAVTVESGGTFAPGDPSTMTVASLTLQPGAEFGEEIGGISPGTGGAGGYDQTVVQSGGTVSLDDATLNLSLVDGFTPSTGDVLTIIDNETGRAVNGTFDGLAQDADISEGGAVWQISYDGGGNDQDVTLKDLSPACFCRGSRILTDRGEVAVEELAVGDLVVTYDRRAVRVSWLGVQTVSTRFADPLRALPIRIKAGALGDNIPCRDLRLSPDHAVFIEEALFQAGALVNGSSIMREFDTPELLAYYHVETEHHELILAENTPAETFIDNVDRLHFDNWAEHGAHYPEGKEMKELPYPRAKSHRQVPMHIRARLAEQARIIALPIVAAA